MTDPYSFDDSRSTFGRRLTLAVAVVGALAVGVGGGYPLQSVVGILGGLTFGVAASAIARDSLRDRVRGSAWLLVSSVLLVGAFLTAKHSVLDGVLVWMLSAAVGTTALATTTTIEDAGMAVLGALGRSALVVFAGTIVASALAANVISGILGSAWAAFSLGVTHLPFFGFVALQFELLAVGLLVGRAGRAAADLDPQADRGPASPMGVRDVPLGVWVLLAVQVLVLALPGGAALFAYVLALAGPVGTVVAVVLTSLYVHAAVLVLVALLGVLPAVQLGRRATVAVIGNRPPKTFAYVAGPVAFVVAVVVVTSIPGFRPAFDWAVTRAGLSAGFLEGYAVAPTLLGAVTGVLVLAAVLLFGLLAITGLAVVPETATEYALAAVALFLATCAAGLTNAPAPAVFVGMASTLLVWDLGETATTVGTELGASADARQPEVVHVMASLGVAVLGVVVASLATHFLVPSMTGLSQDRALAALTLLSVAIVAFATLAYTADTGGS